MRNDYKRALAPILVFMLTTKSLFQAHDKLRLVIIHGLFFSLLLRRLLGLHGLLVVGKFPECSSVLGLFLFFKFFFLKEGLLRDPRFFLRLEFIEGVGVYHVLEPN